MLQIDKEKLISIIVPVYNRRKELLRCLIAIKDQTYNNFEVIVVDDLSNIKIIDIIEDLNDKRFKYIRNIKQGGPLNAMNFGWRASMGDYIIVIGSDWEPFPWMLERVIYYFNKFPFADGITGMHFRVKDSKMFVRVKGGFRIIKPEDSQRLLDLPDCVGAGKKHVIQEFLKRDNNYFATESHLFTLSFFKKFTAVFVDEPWVRYYTDSNDRITLRPSLHAERIVNDCKIFLSDYKEQLINDKDINLDRELIFRAAFLFRMRKWKTLKHYFTHIKRRRLVKKFLGHLIIRLFKKFRKIFPKYITKDDVVWI